MLVMNEKSDLIPVKYEKSDEMVVRIE